VSPVFIGPIRTLVTLINPPLLIWTRNTYLPRHGMSCPKDTCHNPNKLFHDSLFLRCEAKPRVGSDWLLSSSKLQPHLELCRFIQTLLKTKVPRWKAHLLIGIYERTPMPHLSEPMAYYLRYTTRRKGVALGVL
jgi:hypothetical protein